MIAGKKKDLMFLRNSPPKKWNHKHQRIKAWKRKKSNKPIEKHGSVEKELIRVHEQKAKKRKKKTVTFVFGIGPNGMRQHEGYTKEATCDTKKTLIEKLKIPRDFSPTTIIHSAFNGRFQRMSILIYATYYTTLSIKRNTD